MEPIIFNLFKYKFMVDDEKITLIYNNRKVSEAYWVDIVAKALVEDIRIVDLIHDMLNLPEFISLVYLFPTYNLLFDKLSMIRRSAKHKNLSKYSLDRAMKIISICRNYAIDYSGLYIIANRMDIRRWNVATSKTDSKYDKCHLRKIDVSSDDTDAEVNVSIQVSNIIFDVYFNMSNYDNLRVYKSFFESVAIAFAIYYILQTTKHSVNERLQLVNTDCEEDPHSIAYYRSHELLNSFAKDFADKIAIGMMLKNRTDDVKHILLDTELVDARRNSNEKLHRHIQLQNSI